MCANDGVQNRNSNEFISSLLTLQVSGIKEGNGLGVRINEIRYCLITKYFATFILIMTRDEVDLVRFTIYMIIL